jgi:hypothetical protein
VRKALLRKRSLAAVGLAVAAAMTGQTAASAASAGPAAISAGGPGRWSQVTATGTPTIADIGLARGNDGILHVIWVAGSAAGQHSIMDTPVGPGGTVQPRVTIVSNQFTVTGPDATVTPSGLAAFWNGIATNSANSPQGTFEVTRPLRGGRWSPGATIPPLPADPFTSSSDSAGTASDGKPWVAFTGSFALNVIHLGHPERQIPPTACCVSLPGIGTDGSTGVTWLAYLSLISGRQGIYAQRLAASGGVSGGAGRLPGSQTSGLTFPISQRVGITGRGNGRPGVYVLYDTGYPVIRTLEVIRLGTTAPVKLASFGGFAEQVAGDTITAGPNGRLWATWFFGQDTPPALFVRASGTTGTTFGKTVRVPLPSGTSVIWKVYTSAQAGRLDVLALLTRSGRTAYYATQVLLPK